MSRPSAVIIHLFIYLTFSTSVIAQPPGGFPASGCDPFNTASCTTTTTSTSSASSSISTSSSVFLSSSPRSSSFSTSPGTDTSSSSSSSSTDSPISIIVPSKSFTSDPSGSSTSMSASSPYSSTGSGPGSNSGSSSGSGSAYGNTGSPYGSSSGDGSGNSGFAFSSLPIFSKLHSVLIAHAVCACLAWALFFPIGGIIIRVLHSRHLVWLHAALQLFAYAMFTAAVGMGIWMARQFDQYFDIWHDSHVIIGLTVFALVFFQPILGFVHHHIFKTRGVGRRTGYAYLHVWLGRALITLGIINGGLGIRLTGSGPTQSHDTTRRAEIAYGVLAGLVWVLYMVVMVWAEMPRKGGNGSNRDSAGPPAMWVRTMNREGDERKSIDEL